MVIHFVCRGNAFRSIIAEAYLNSLGLSNVTVISSGTRASAYKESNAANFSRTLALLKKHSIQQYAKNHYADDLSQSLIDQSDIMIFLNDIAYKEAIDSYKLPAKYYVWDVTDLGEKGRIATTETEREAFSNDVYDEIVSNVNSLVGLNKLRND